MSVGNAHEGLEVSSVGSAEARLAARLNELAGGASTHRSKDVAWAMASRVGGQLMGFVTTPVLARVIAPSGFGVVAVASVFTGFIWLLSDLGLGAVLVRRTDLRNDLVTTAFYINLALGILAAAVIVGISFPLAIAYGMPSLRLVLPIVGLQMVLSMEVVPTALLERAFRFRTLALIEFTAALLAAVATVTMAIAGLGLVSLVAGPLVALVFQDCAVWSVVRLVPRGRPTREALRQVWSFSGPLMIFNTLMYWARNIDNMVLGLVAGATALGLYARAYVLMLVPVTQITVVLGRVLLPSLSRYRDQLEAMRASYLRALRLSSAVTIPAGAGLVCLASPLVALLFGHRWHGMVFLLEVLSATVPIQVVVATAGPIYQALGETRMWSRRASVTTVVTMIALCVGALSGANGVAIGFAAAWFGLARFAVSQPWGLIGLSVREGIRCVRASLLSSLVMVLWLLALDQVGSRWGAAAWLAVGAGSGTAIYFGMMRLIGRPVLQELTAEAKRLRS